MFYSATSENQKQTSKSPQSDNSDAFAFEKSGDAGDGLSLLEQLAERSGARFSKPLTPLNQIKQSGDKACRNPNAPILFGKHESDGKALIFRAKCKQWGCPSCGARNAKRAVAYLLNHINKVGGQWFFVTITAHEKWRGPEASYENLSRNWHKLRKRMRAENGGHFDYFRVWEHHTDDTFHMHLLTNCVLPYKEYINKKDQKAYYSRWLKDNARQSGLGFMTDYQPLENAGYAAHYVAKYMAKSVGDAGKWIKGQRRYQTSQGWTSLPDLTESTDFDWTYVENSNHMWFEYHDTKDKGFEIFISGKSGKASSRDAVDFYLHRKEERASLHKPKIYKSTELRE